MLVIRTTTFFLAHAFCLSACTTEQAYNSVKGWQRNECNHRIDNREREQCLKDAHQGYEDYNRQRAE